MEPLEYGQMRVMGTIVDITIWGITGWTVSDKVSRWIAMWEILHEIISRRVRRVTIMERITGPTSTNELRSKLDAGG